MNLLCASFSLIAALMDNACPFLHHVLMECALESLLNAPKHSHLTSFVSPSVAVSCFGTQWLLCDTLFHKKIILQEDSETEKLTYTLYVWPFGCDGPPRGDLILAHWNVLRLDKQHVHLIRLIVIYPQLDMRRPESPFSGLGNVLWLLKRGPIIFPKKNKTPLVFQ